MPLRPFLIVSQSDYVIQTVDIKFTYWMTNSADPDQLVLISQLIWIYTVCKGRVYPDSAVQGLTLTMLCADSSDGNLTIFFLFLHYNRIWHFMQIVSYGDNLHKMSNPIFWQKYEKIFQNVVCCNMLWVKFEHSILLSTKVSKNCWMSGKQSRLLNDTVFSPIWSGYRLFAQTCLFEYLG